MKISFIVQLIADGKLHEALVHLFHGFRSDHPAFLDAEKSALDNRDEYDRFKEMFDTLLFENARLKIENRTVENPLAVMEVLDRYLFEKYSRKGNPPPVSRTVEGQKYYIRRRVLGYRNPPPHHRQTGHLQSWLTYHWLIPASFAGYDLIIKPAPQRHLPVQRFSGKQTVRVYFSGFPDEVEPAWENPVPNSVVAYGLKDTKTRKQSIIVKLEDAWHKEADIVVFPELTICPELRRFISEWLHSKKQVPFSMILAGSFHEKQHGKIYNYAELTSRTGKRLIEHRKLKASGDKSFREGIDFGNRIELLDTPIGLVGIPICLDFCEEGEPFGRLWSALGPEWLLVPAFGDEKNIHAHKRRAQALSIAHGTVCAIANQNPGGQDKDHGFLHVIGGAVHGQEHEGTCVQVDIDVVLIGQKI